MATWDYNAAADKCAAAEAERIAWHKAYGNALSNAYASGYQSTQAHDLARRTANARIFDRQYDVPDYTRAQPVTA